MPAKYLLVLTATLLVVACTNSLNQNKSYGVGKSINESQITAWNIDIAPNGGGLPPGGATAKLGE